MSLEGFTAGDPAALEALFREYQQPVYRWIMRIVRDRGAAEELTVETFWRAWNARARFDTTRSFGAWIRRIAGNLALNHLKKHRGLPLPVEPAAADAGDPALESETRAAIARAFGDLPPKLRAAATLALIEEEPYDEIAAGLGISVNGVKSRVFRAVRILRKKLEWIRID